jgi:hypothetical protein
MYRLYNACGAKGAVGIRCDGCGDGDYILDLKELKLGA